ncbi:DNA-packaging protein FI [Escherichia albertii]|uniref:DNA-packaging protein FI n=1 Tax=Escherichia albertii TaxID=208962 RepID=UPI000CF6B294|nr:DNA-packaging protein FI [Escherichia albertii]EFB5187756.1 DNA breaking-rejoining protein [Escherichia albertii]
MTKEQITERLQELAAILGREADISGSKADLEQRLAEWEEEAAGFDMEAEFDTEEEGAKSEYGEVSDNRVRSEQELVRVRMLKTAHMPARDAVTGKMLMFAPASGVVLVNEAIVSELIAGGLAEKVRE